jgi:hyperosmotically inducible periplasmic protein
MTLRTMKGTVMTFVLFAALFTFSCKGKEEDKSTDATSTENTGRDVTGDTATSTTPSTSPTTTATVTEDQLKDAIKDYPNVTATVNNGEVTLTGSIKREELPKLMQRVQALNPTKVNNNLSIK